jgi:hypothetical protein
MALINCPECSKEISNSAETCLNCGYPIKEYVIALKEKIRDIGDISNGEKKLLLNICEVVEESVSDWEKEFLNKYTNYDFGEDFNGDVVEDMINDIEKFWSESISSSVKTIISNNNTDNKIISNYSGKDACDSQVTFLVKTGAEFMQVVLEGYEAIMNGYISDINRMDDSLNGYGIISSDPIAFGIYGLIQTYRTTVNEVKVKNNAYETKNLRIKKWDKELIKQFKEIFKSGLIPRLQEMNNESKKYLITIFCDEMDVLYDDVMDIYNSPEQVAERKEKQRIIEEEKRKKVIELEKKRREEEEKRKKIEEEMRIKREIEMKERNKRKRELEGQLNDLNQQLSEIGIIAFGEKAEQKKLTKQLIRNVKNEIANL